VAQLRWSPGNNWLAPAAARYPVVAETATTAANAKFIKWHMFMGNTTL
jgi:hypothetical protein